TPSNASRATGSGSRHQSPAPPRHEAPANSQSPTMQAIPVGLGEGVATAVGADRFACASGDSDRLPQAVANRTTEAASTAPMAWRGRGITPPDAATGLCQTGPERVVPQRAGVAMAVPRWRGPIATFWSSETSTEPSPRQRV